MAEQHLERTLSELVSQREQKIAEIAKLDAAIEAIRKLIGAEPLSKIKIRIRNPASASAHSSAHMVVETIVKAGDLFGKAQAEAAQEYLRRIGRAAHLDEIFAGLQRGGATLQGKNPKKNLYISLVKKKSIFPLVAAYTFGLWEFYPDAKQKPNGGGQSRIFEQLKEIMQDGKSRRITKILVLLEEKFGQPFPRSSVVSALRRGKEFRRVKRGAYKLKAA